MKFSKQAKIGLIVSLMFYLATGKTYHERYDDYCALNAAQRFNLSETERADGKSKSRPPFLSLDAVEDFTKRNSVGKIVSEVGGQIILTFVLAAFCLLTFVIFLGFLCCCNRANSAADKTALACWITSIVFTMAFAGLFATSMVFMGKTWSDSNSSNCFFASTTKKLIEGVNATDFNYIGLNKLIEIFKEFGGEVSNISTFASDFEVITRSNVHKMTSSALGTLQPFYDKYKDSKTNDGSGEKSKPISIQDLNSNINDAIFAEFSLLDQISARIVNAALIGKGYSQSMSYVIVQSSISSLTSNIEKLVGELIDFYDKIASGFEAYNTSFIAGLTASIVAGGIFLLLGVTSIIFVGRMIYKQNNLCRDGVKILINVNAFLTLILSLAAVVVFGASIVVGSGCNILDRLLATSDPVGIFDRLNITFDDVLVKTLNQCLPEEASGNLTPVIASDLSLTESIEAFIDGFSTFDTLKANLNESNSTTRSVQSTAEMWKRYKISLEADQPKALDSLSLFNNLVSCDNISYKLNALNCSSDNCKGIYNTSSFSAPICSSNPAYANSLFLNLKAFTNDEDNLLGAMIKDLTELQTPTPGNLNTVARAALTGLLPYLRNVAQGFNKTLAVFNQMQNGFSQNTNCTVLRHDIKNLENAICFSLNKNLYMFALFLILAVVLAFAGSWMICCALRYVPGDLDHVFFVATHTNNDYTAHDTEIRDMNNSETSKDQF